MNNTAVPPAPLHQAQLFACAGNRDDTDNLAEAAHAWARSLPDALHSEIGINDPGPDSMGLGDAFTTEASGLPDILVSLAGEDQVAVVRHFARLASEIGLGLSPASAILGARRHCILPGDGPVRLFYAISRLPGLSREQFQHYWLNQHAELGRQLIPPYSYFQSHSDDQLNTSLADATGLTVSPFDGVVALHFPDRDACDRQLGRADVNAIALEDEKKFIDHERVLMGCYRVLPREF